MKLQVQQKIQAGFAVALAFLLVIGVSALWSEQRNAEIFRAVEHTYQVLDQLESMLVGMLNTETGYRGFVITGDETFLQPQQAGIAAIQESLTAAKRLTQDNPDQQRRLAALEPLIQEKISRANTVVKLRRSGDTAGAVQFIATGQGKAVMDEIRRRVAEMEAAEEHLLQQRSDRARAATRTTEAIVALGGLLSLGLVGLASVIVRRDFEKRQQAEAERDRFFTLSLDLLCIAKTDGYFKRVNPAFVTTLGWSAEEILARPFLELIHPDDRAATVREMEKLAAGQPVLLFEHRFQCKDGAWKTLAWRAMPQPDGTFYCTGRDMTESKLAADNLRRSEENLTVTLDSIGDAVLATDTGGRVMRLNPVAEKLMGWTQAEALGRPVKEVFRIINEDTREPAVIPVDDVLATGEIHGLANHTVLIARDGTERPVADSAAPIRDKDGQILGVVLVFRDVTEEHAAQRALRESEERVRLATEAAGIAVWAWDIRSGAIHWDDRMFSFYGLPPKPDGWVNYEDWRARVLPADLAEQEAQLQRTVATCGHSQREFRIVRASDQAVRVIHAAEMAVAGVAGLADRVVGINIDITERKQMEKGIVQLNTELQERAAQLKAANKELEAFSYTVSHDLRAPLRHIQGYIQMLTTLIEGQLTDKARHYLKTITDASMEMGQLIDDLLAFSRMGRVEMIEDSVALDGLLRKVLHDLEMAVQGRNIEWQIAPLPPVVGDASLLRQVLANLVGNAVKYTRPRDPARIEIGCAGEEDGRIIFFVRDNGAGFDMQYADKLFGVFQRLHRAEDFEGTGIGLATVRRIISRHGGRTWAEGVLNQGATFYFTLKPAATV